MDWNCLLISNEDILGTNLIKINNMIQIIEKALTDFRDGEKTHQKKDSQIFNRENQERINCMIATLPQYDICGVKWVSVFPNNPHMYGLQNATSVAIISNIKTGMPLAFIDFSLCTALRTAAVNAIAVKWLANKDSRSIGLIGAGTQAIANFIAIKNVCPNIKICRVSSRTRDSEELFIKKLERYYQDITFISCKGVHKDVVNNSDILVSATSTQAPLIKKEWIHNGMLYCHVAGYEDEYEVVKRADKIICDAWSAVKHREQTISKMYKEGLLFDKDINADLYEIISMEKEGRSNHNEFIYFNSVGLPYIDVTIARYLYMELANSENVKKFKISNNQLLNEDIINYILK